MTSNVFDADTSLQVFDGTVSFDKDFMAFATPNPQPMPKWMALISPFHFYVWICVVGSVIVSRGAIFLYHSAVFSLKLKSY